jgi:hypothetical protein
VDPRDGEVKRDRAPDGRTGASVAKMSSVS